VPELGALIIYRQVYYSAALARRFTAAISPCIASAHAKRHRTDCFQNNGGITSLTIVDQRMLLRMIKSANRLFCRLRSLLARRKAGNWLAHRTFRQSMYQASFLYRRLSLLLSIDGCGQSIPEEFKPCRRPPFASRTSTAYTDSG
jgi:hypothetical protein